MATYFVSQTGSNTSPWDTAARGKTTIAAGIALLSGGDTLMIDDGVYPEELDRLIPGGPSNSARTIIKAIHQNQVTIRPPGGSIGAITLKSHTAVGDNITFDGLDCDAINGGGSCAPYYTAQTGGVAYNISIINGTMRNGRGEFGSGTALASNDPIGSNHYIANCLIYNNGDPAFPNHAHGIYGQATDSLYENNTIHGNAGYGIQITDGDNTIVRNNRIYAQVNRAGIWLASNTTKTYNNLIYGNNTAVVKTSSGGGIELDSATSNRVYNNSIYGNSGRGIWQTSGSSNEFKNNIIHGNTTDTIVVDAGTSTSLTNQIGGSNPFVDAPGGDFHLIAGATAAIDVGTDLSSAGGFTTDFAGSMRPIGSGWDIGAYEYGAIAPPSGSGRHLIANDPFAGGVLVALGGNWQQLDPAEGTISKTAAGFVGGSSAGTVAVGARWVAHSFGDDQYSSVVFKALAATADESSSIGVIARASGDINTARDMYYVSLTKNLSGTITTYLAKINNGTILELDERNDVAWTVGDRIEIECEGSSIRALKNGSVLMDSPDSSIPSGNPGAFAYGTLDSLGDDWEGGNLNDSEPSVPAHKGRRLVFMKVGR